MTTTPIQPPQSQQSGVIVTIWLVAGMVATVLVLVLAVSAGGAVPAGDSQAEIDRCDYAKAYAKASISRLDTDDPDLWTKAAMLTSAAESACR